MTMIYMFPGQGSQCPGMGLDLFDKYSNVTEKANEILGFDLRELCHIEGDERLNQTQFTQPALFTVEALSFDELAPEVNSSEMVCLGHSLGEYAALYAAGVIDFESGLKIVKKRGELMGQVKGGAMAAVIGLTPDKITQILKDSGENEIDQANFNAPTQVVISGPESAIQRVKPLFEENKATYIILKVSGAFHSRYMEGVAADFGEYLNNFEFSEPKRKVISNYSTAPYSLEKVKENLIMQLQKPVRWVESIQPLLTLEEPQFVEVGPGKVLSGLLRKIKRGR